MDINDKSSRGRSEILGAAFLMATSAVGPGFLNNTTVFTEKLLASFGFVILLSVILDIFAQMNIWRVVAIRRKPAQQIANETIPASGHILAALIAFGGLAFNIGNIGGCALGLNVIFGLDLKIGAAVSAAIAIAIFVFKEAGKVMDLFSKILGLLMILLILYVCYRSNPPYGEALVRTIAPLEIDPLATVTLVGGTVGGYITFAGAHRLLDAGISGAEHLREVNRGAISGILITTLIRFLLFLAAFGVVAAGVSLDKNNPAASVFDSAAGQVGMKIFGVVLFCAAITSVVGAAYTSVSFLKTFHTSITKHSRYVIIGFILLSTIIFIALGRPALILVVAGVLNGFILPVGLGLILIAAMKRSDDEIHHPKWLLICGWLVVLVMGILSLQVLWENL